ncbi:MAG: RNA polymerase sigma-54 factor, partial [Planctomycetota bacterium]
SGGEERAREDVRDLVRNVFANEDPAAPLSDDEVVISMRQRGFELARRTVAKYRQELDIPSSYRRRRYA